MTSGTWLVGRGLADITGEAAECMLMGYGRSEQTSEGIHLRLRARAFVIADPGTGRRVLLVVSDLAMIFDSVHREVLARLGQRFGDRYTATNVMLTATHTHCGPGGYSHHRLYITAGFHPQTFAAIVDGIVEASCAADADVAPATLAVAHGELTDASVNRSRAAFDRNPAEERAVFPDAIDPQTTVLRIERDGRAVGAINWFATHGTSMSNHNRLISGDNKGYAAYRWERLVAGVDYRAGTTAGPHAGGDFVAAFAQTNAGDMSPNLNLAPGSGPTDDEVANTRIIGERQQRAAAELLAGPATALDVASAGGGVDSRLTWVDLSRTTVDATHTGDGRDHQTGPAAAGASTFAGTEEGPAFRSFHQGTGANPVWGGVSRHVVYRLSSRMREAHQPKEIVLSGRTLNRVVAFVQERYPVQLVRIGRLYLIGVPGEATIVAGLRLRRAVAEVVGAELADVLVAGYANAYCHYVTTPEEYDEQRYEGGSTLFGRWELGALIQAATGLARAMADGVAADPGTGTPPLPRPPRPRRRRHRVDEPMAGRAFGDVLTAPGPSCRAGERVTAVFVGGHPDQDLRRGGTYLEVERANGEGWETVADDGDWATTFHWARVGRQASRITVRWEIPADAPAGEYRIRYFGDTVDADGRRAAIDTATEPFTVSA